METLVNKVMGPYLRSLIKDYRKDQLNISTLSGTGSMSNVELIGSAVSEMLMIPPMIQIESAKCDQMNIKIPYTKLKKEPVTIDMGRIELTIIEPDEILPRGSNLSALGKTTGANTDFATSLSVVRDVKVTIKAVFFTFRTKGANTYRPDWKPSLQCSMHDITVQNTNENFEVVPLPETRKKEGNTEYLHKVIEVKGMTTTVQMNDNEPALPIFTELPVKIHWKTDFDVKSKVWTASSMQLMLDEVHFEWNQSVWQHMADLFFALQACFRREIPLAQPTEGIDLSSNRISYGVNVNTCSLLLGDQDGGWKMNGDSIHCTLSPARKTSYTVKDLTYRGLDYEVECWQSDLVVHMKEVSLHEYPLSTVKKYPYLFQKRISDDKLAPTSEKWLSATLCYRFDIADPSKRHLIPDFELQTEINGSQIVLDKKVIRGLYDFLIEGPIEGLASLGAQEVNEMLHKEGLLEKGRKFQSMHAKFHILAVQSHLIFPHEVDSENVWVQGYSSVGYCDKIAITNQPDWPFPPFLADALQLLPVPREALTPEEGTVHKFQFEFHGVQALLEARDEADLQVMQPTLLKMYGRYFPSWQRTETSHKLEITMYADEIDVTARMSHIFYAYHTLRTNLKWAMSLYASERERQRIFRLLGEATQAIRKDVGETGEIMGYIRSKEARQQAIVKSVKYSLDHVELTVFGRVEKATGKLPSLGAWIPEAGAEQVQFSMAERDAQVVTMEGNRMEFVVDNHITSQASVMRMKSLHVGGIDHPNLPCQMEIRPLSDTALPSQSLYALYVSYLGSMADGKLVDSKVRVSLQNILILALLKRNMIEKGMKDIIPEANHLLSKAVRMYREIGVDAGTVKDRAMDMAQSRLEEGLDTAKQVIGVSLDDINYEWMAEMGDCAMKMVEMVDGEAITRGLLQLSNASKDALNASLLNIEEQLMQAKLALAHSEAENFDLKTEAKQSSQKAKQFQQDMRRLEQQLVQTKLQMAELQAENDELMNERMKLRKKK